MTGHTLLYAMPYRMRQRGAALLIILTIIGVGAATLLVTALNKASQRIDRDKITAAALAQAKEALVGFGTSVILTTSGITRPGDLPCPDLNDDGFAEPSCDIQGERLGRLPWRTLSLPDLHDNAGERLWYAVSANFKNSTRIGTLNSDTPGTLTVRDSGGAILFDGTGATGAIALIFSPGLAFTRQDGYGQDRTCVPCNAQAICTAIPATNTPRCNARNYLDITLGEDNANFQDSNANGFIQGPVTNAGTIVVNDQFIAITSQDLMPSVEKRVAGETLKCLTDYAAIAANQGHYPWAAPLNPSAAPSYSDASNARFGRVPDSTFNQSRIDSGNAMSNAWGFQCNIASSSGWWLNWKEMVFYSVASAYGPALPLTAPSCGGCLTVTPPSATANKQVAVFVAGRRLAGVAAGQPRASNNNKGTIANYLENQNATPADDVFERSAMSPLFNDATAFAP